MNVFNTREIALFIWIAILIIYLMTGRSGRESIFKILRSLFTTKMGIIYLSMLAYVFMIVYTLFQFGLWDTSQLKNTVVWVLTVGSAAMFDVTNDKKGNYFKITVKDVFQFTLVSEFIIGFYTFNIFIELLIIPLAVMISGMSFVSEKDRKYELLRKPLKNILALSGLFLICYSVYRISTDFFSFATKGTLSEFLIPPALSFLFLPYVYILSIYINYEDVFTGVDRVIKKRSLIRYAKIQAFLHFHFNKSHLKRWRKSVFIRNPETKKDILASIKLIKELSEVEGNPPDVPFDKGWSPYKAKDYLTTEGIRTRYYESVYEDEWCAISSYIDLDDSILSNNIAYYVSGDKALAKKLQIVLNVNSPQKAKYAHMRLLTASKKLYQSALNRSMPNAVEQAIELGMNRNVEEGNRKVSIVKNIYPNARNNGYSMEFIIQV